MSIYRQYRFDEGEFYDENKAGRQHIYVEAIREKTGNIPTRGVEMFVKRLRELRRIRVPSLGLEYSLWNVQSYQQGFKDSTRFRIYFDIICPSSLKESELETLYAIIRSRIKAIFSTVRKETVKYGQFTLGTVNVDILNP